MTELSVLPFGKYKGDTVMAVLKKDPSYICWLSNRTNLKVHKRVFDKAALAVERQPRKVWFGDLHWGDEDEEWMDSPDGVYGHPGCVVGPFGD